jgi:hypothetical protein
MIRLLAVGLLASCVILAAAWAGVESSSPESHPAAPPAERAEQPVKSHAPIAQPAHDPVGPVQHPAQLIGPTVDLSHYPEWVTKQYAPWVLEFIAECPEAKGVISVLSLAAKPLVFLFLFFGIGSIFSRLAAAALGVPCTASGQALDERAQLIRARAALVVRLFALAVACEAVGLKWVGGLASLVVGLTGAILTGLWWLIAVGLIVYAASAHGRALVLNTVGWGYIERARRQQQREAKPVEYDLGEGRKGRILRVDCFLTTFDLGRGETLERANHEVLRDQFKWSTGIGPS